MSQASNSELFRNYRANLREFPMHTGLKDDVDNFRLCVRSITLDPITHFLYWRDKLAYGAPHVRRRPLLQSQEAPHDGCR